MNKLLSALTLVLITFGISSAHAGPSWGFTLENGAGFYWGSNRPQQNYYYYQAPYPPQHYHQPQLHFYIPPQPMYMMPYQQMRPYHHYRPCR